MRGAVQDSLLALIVSLAALAPLVTMTSVKKSNRQLRVKPQPSSSSGLPVLDLLESPDAKYDPKPKDIDRAALRLRLKGESFFFVFFLFCSVLFLFVLKKVFSLISTLLEHNYRLTSILSY